MKHSIVKHLSSKDWNCEVDKNWVGGKVLVSNLSSGYHGLLKEWFDHYNIKKSKCLLISENQIVKNEFKMMYPQIEFKTLEFYEDMNQIVDLKYNLCESWDRYNIEKFDIILCQATFEHLYDPCTAIKNLNNILNLNGVILIHTHVPGMPYHPYPKDYLRFYPDWFKEVSNFVKDLQLVELIEANYHIFSAYKKIGNNNV
jgi:SAM-dependent methyltransferase